MNNSRQDRPQPPDHGDRNAAAPDMHLIGNKPGRLDKGKRQAETEAEMQAEAIGRK